MADTLIEVMQLVGSLLALGTATAAVVWYVILWPFDRTDHRTG